VKLKRLTIAGFRGFNLERSIDFHERLTVIAAPNSHGKTSISEALEFLIYGATSKVEKADSSKEEYKNSYRNRHFPKDKPSYVEATFSVAQDIELNLRVELDADGITTRRFVDGAPVEIWPFHATLDTAARPFVLQHALKYLLLVPPSDRFQGFARLLGLNEVDGTFQSILGLCTKPTASISPEGQLILNELLALETRVIVVPELKNVATNFKRGAESADDAYALIDVRSDALLGEIVKAAERVPKLIAARTKAAAKVYSGDITLYAYSQEEASQLAFAHKTLSTAMSAMFLEDYGQLCVYDVTVRLQKQATLLNIGVELLEERPEACPLCGQLLNAELRTGISERHASVKAEIEKGTIREQRRSRVAQVLAEVKKSIKEHLKLSERRTESLIRSMQPENAPKVYELLGGENTASAEVVRSAAETANGLIMRLRAASADIAAAILNCESGIAENRMSVGDAETLSKAMLAYLAKACDFVSQVAPFEPSLAESTKLFRQNVDALAGTSEVSLLIDLIEKRKTIERALRVRDVLDGLKDLKKHVEQTLAETMEAAMSTDLTNAVMKWYDAIRTDGDPDVHFSGFAMEKTKTGDFKSRRLSVQAKSYGVNLASAVSSLSESKLNALGLSVSIASAIRSPGPWGFLIIDDPIQSWDDEHETRFIDVIRSLVETENKQVVVLSHKVHWAKQLCQGCRTLNGLHCEITRYTKDGPHIVVMEWSTIDQRLREVDAIVSDSTATSVKLQQGEEEIRHLACQVASQVAKEKLSRTTSAHNMNSKDVRAIFVEAGVTADLVDRISAMFVTADDAHHAPKNYTPNIQRIRQAAGAIREVLNQTKKA
jgi:AAA domain